MAYQHNDNMICYLCVEKESAIYDLKHQQSQIRRKTILNTQTHWKEIQHEKKQSKLNKQTNK